MISAHGTVKSFAVQEFDPVMAEQAAMIGPEALCVLFDHLWKLETPFGERG